MPNKIRTFEVFKHPWESLFHWAVCGCQCASCTEKENATRLFGLSCSAMRLSCSVMVYRACCQVTAAYPLQ